MPFTKHDMEVAPISFSGTNSVMVWTGPCSATSWKGSKIPLDGRQYESGGEIILKNGQRLRASLLIKTTDFDFLIRAGTYVNVDEVWYRWDESELLEKLGLSSQEAFPFFWITDRPLDYHVQGPYPMCWPDNNDWDKK
jgi:hypothetical protein